MPDTPFRHWIIDDALPENSAQALVAEWRAVKDWKARFGPRCDGKFTSTTLGPLTRDIVWTLNSDMHALSKVTGIQGLVPDPTLEGGGLHKMEPGGYLGVHTDFNKLGTLDRRLNLLIFLNPEWHDDWGGELELWDDEPRVRILPKWRRGVLFETHETSWHACAKVTGPLERRTLALYFYTHGNGEKGHGTIYR